MEDFGGHLAVTQNLKQKECPNFSAWDRIVWIASIQARIWNYTGPYGFGDLDMLGLFFRFLIDTDDRGRKWYDIGRTENAFQSMGIVQESSSNWDPRIALFSFSDSSFLQSRRLRFRF